MPRTAENVEVSPIVPKNGARGALRIQRAARNSLSGLRAAWKREAAFRQEVVGAVLLTAIMFTVPLTALERGMLLASIGVVLVVELLNSAIEAVVDLVSPDHHALAGLAKDVGSAAVLLALVLAAVIWFMVLVW